MGTSVAILDELFNAFNAHDLDRFMEFVAEDCVLQMPRGSQPWEPGTREKRPYGMVSQHVWQDFQMSATAIRRIWWPAMSGLANGR